MDDPGPGRLAPAEPELTATERAGERAAKNATARAVGEIVGKLASLALFAVLAREVGQSELGAFVFALAWVQIAAIPITLGLDRYILRLVAKDRSRIQEVYWNVLAFKLTLAVPMTIASFLLVSALGYGGDTRTAVYVLTAGVLLDSLARTHYSLFNAYERSELLAICLVVQRVAAAALGLAVLAAGYGIVAVSITYTCGTALGLVLAIALLTRKIGRPRRSLTRERWPALASRSLPFAAQDVFTVLLFKVDAVILSLMAAEAAVGRYGAAYRLFEATFFLTYALTGAFAPMYTYLERDSEPSVGSVFQRSLKLGLVALVPCAVAFGILAEPLCRLFFGAEFEAAADPLRLLAPVVVLIGLATLCSSLIVSRRDPTIMVWVTAAMVALNVGLNVALIPSLDDTGAALAMLITEAVLLVIALTIAVRSVGGVRWVSTAVSPLVAGAAMAAPMLLLQDTLVPAALAGTAVYALVFIGLERVISPVDLRFVGSMLRRRLPGRAAT